MGRANCSLVSSAFKRPQQEHPRKRLLRADEYRGKGHVILSNCGPGMRDLLEMLRHPLARRVDIVVFAVRSSSAVQCSMPHAV